MCGAFFVLMVSCAVRDQQGLHATTTPHSRQWGLLSTRLCGCCGTHTRALDEKVHTTTSTSGMVMTRSITHAPKSDLMRVLIEEYRTLWVHLMLE